MSTLWAKNLVKRYKGRTVVNGISLHVESGEVVGLLGTNGAGKTTSFYIIVGLIQAEQGKVFIDNHDITLAPMHTRARLGLGYLPQEPSIFRKLSVKDNILAILELRPLSKKERLQRLDELLHEFHIGHLRNNSAISLSGGERRRLEIARALAVDPQFILLDEPFAGIDPINVHDIRQIIQHLCDRGIGVLITDHSVKTTLESCHRAYIVNEGKVIADGDPSSIVSNEKVREVYLGKDFQM